METTQQQAEQLQEQLEFIQMFPWLVLVALTIPLIIVARRKVYPHVVYPLALLIPTVLTAGIMFDPSWLVPALAADALILACSLLDYSPCHQLLPCELSGITTR